MNLYEYGHLSITGLPTGLPVPIEVTLNGGPTGAKTLTTTTSSVTFDKVVPGRDYSIAVKAAGYRFTSDIAADHWVDSSCIRDTSAATWQLKQLTPGQTLPCQANLRALGTISGHLYGQNLQIQTAGSTPTYQVSPTTTGLAGQSVTATLCGDTPTLVPGTTAVYTCTEASGTLGSASLSGYFTHLSTTTGAGGAFTFAAPDITDIHGNDYQGLHAGT